MVALANLRHLSGLLNISLLELPLKTRLRNSTSDGSLGDFLNESEGGGGALPVSLETSVIMIS